MKYFRFLLWAALLIIGFIAGAAWKSAERTAQDAEATGQKPRAVTVREDAAGPDSTQDLQQVDPLSRLTPEELATIRIFEEARPSVCFITTTNLRRLDFFSRDVTEIPRGTGSGFVWDKDGHIITNYHVLQGADRATVTLADRSTWQATLVGYAPEKDLAVLKIEAPRNQLHPIPLGTSDHLRVGQSVYAIGNPFGLDQTLTTGIVSALGREIESVAGVPIRDAIQTDAAINPGNSGGPLLDSSGRLIGVNTAIYSPSGASAGIGFSIPVDVVSWVVPDLIRYGKINRPSLGVELARQQISQRLGIEGGLVINVIPDSPAEKAGIRPTMRNRYGEIMLGDVMVSIGEDKIRSSNDLILALEKYKPGDRVVVRLLREDKPIELQLELQAAE